MLGGNILYIGSKLVLYSAESVLQTGRLLLKEEILSGCWKSFLILKIGQEQKRLQGHHQGTIIGIPCVVGVGSAIV
jgi:hypothetical protein